MRQHLDAAGRRVTEGDTVMATMPGKTIQVWMKVTGFTPRKIWCVPLESLDKAERLGTPVPSHAHIMRYAEQIVLVRTFDGQPVETRDHDYRHKPVRN
ncbi:hypothetical protein [Arthrobacter caoxuetaonis]|uniref:Uncharacterized protein n=1 Tax=Arthrobacter caoxuetaonis TaxID=2886935 RepID=A0A9X1MJH2_9MICC|nr:hypothetical protein [Arthrobacter caoxuetaonis]MCC3299659.1 hypothetical protein [Arthrobacter caoxuetaonis]USQ58999.1 hypothetical protein NF551_18000 [Arthrobacter caoxuetaonis]